MYAYKARIALSLALCLFCPLSASLSLSLSSFLSLRVLSVDACLASLFLPLDPPFPSNPRNDRATMYPRLSSPPPPPNLPGRKPPTNQESRRGSLTSEVDSASGVSQARDSFGMGVSFDSPQSRHPSLFGSLERGRRAVAESEEDARRRSTDLRRRLERSASPYSRRGGMSVVRHPGGRGGLPLLFRLL